MHYMFQSYVTTSQGVWSGSFPSMQLTKSTLRLNQAAIQSCSPHIRTGSKLQCTL